MFLFFKAQKGYKSTLYHTKKKKLKITCCPKQNLQHMLFRKVHSVFTWYDIYSTLSRTMLHLSKIHPPLLMIHSFILNWTSNNKLLIFCHISTSFQPRGKSNKGNATPTPQLCFPARNRQREYNGRGGTRFKITGGMLRNGYGNAGVGEGNRRDDLQHTEAHSRCTGGGWEGHEWRWGDRGRWDGTGEWEREEQSLGRHLASNIRIT